jgi:hypothetical protein
MAEDDGRTTKCEPDKTIDRLINLLTHQNTLLWSRLQTLSALQVPVLGGWYFFFVWNPRFDLAAYVSLLGVVLSSLIWQLIHCDADRRDYLRKSVKDVEQPEAQLLFPENHKQRFLRVWSS